MLQTNIQRLRSLCSQNDILLNVKYFKVVNFTCKIVPVKYHYHLDSDVPNLSSL